MKYNNYDITKIYYSGYTVTAAYGCGGYQVFEGIRHPKITISKVSGSSKSYTIYCNGSSLLTQSEVDECYRQVSGCCVHIDVGDCVKYLGSGATNITEFRSNCLVSVTLPEGLVNLGYSTFAGCYSLQSINIPTSIKRIPTTCFHYSGLKTIDLHSGITEIGTHAFEGCTALESIYVRSTTPPTLNTGAFDNTNNCPIYVISDLVNVYKSASGWSNYASRIQGYEAPKKFKGLNSGSTTTINLVLCNSNTTLTSGETKPSSSMMSAEIGDCVTSIGGQAFYICNIASIILPDSVTSIGDKAFSNCTRLASINFPSGVTSIGEQAFWGCSITSIDLPDTVTSVGQYVFYQCSGLTSCTIGSGITTIGNYAFMNCSGLTSCTIGSGITTIGNMVFTNCKSLESFTIYAATPPTMGISAFSGTDSSKLKIYVPAGSVDAYKAANNWSTYASLIQAIPT